MKASILYGVFAVFYSVYRQEVSLVMQNSVLSQSKHPSSTLPLHEPYASLFLFLSFSLFTIVLYAIDILDHGRGTKFNNDGSMLELHSYLLPLLSKGQAEAEAEAKAAGRATVVRLVALA
jgi:hypothetical protein